MPIITSNISSYNNTPIGISGSIAFANTQQSNSDTVFFVSGSDSSRSVFGGTLLVSGSLVVSGSMFFGDDASQDSLQVRAGSVFTGNVGIGSTSTAARLLVSGTSTASNSTVIIREGVASPTGGAEVLDVQNSSGTSLLVVSGSGFVGVGTTTTITSNKLSVFGPTAATTFSGHLLLSSDSASSAADNGGQLNFQMYDGTSLRGAALIKGAKENGTSGNYASYLSFGTRVNGDSVLTERMRIDSTGSIGIGLTTPTARLSITGSSSTSQPVLSVQAGTANQAGGTKVFQVLKSDGSGIFHVSGSGDVNIDNGNLVIGTAGKGIDFSSSANAASGTLGQELLDDYEEGTFTPGLTVAGGTITSTRAGYYTKVGRNVDVKFFIDVSAVSGTRTTMTITGLPFQVDVTYTNAFVECYNLNNSIAGLTGNFSHGLIWTNATSNSLTLDIYLRTSGVPITNPAAAVQVGTIISGHLVYFTNQ